MDMVTKVATALAGAKGFAFSGFDAQTQQTYRKMARAAIEAMLEPTKEMVIAGDEEKELCIDSDWSSDADGNRHDYTTIDSDLPARVFRAMISAALGDQP